MKRFVIEPEVAGSIADGSIIDRSTHPPRISHLHYEFDGWLGDALLESFPCFIITAEGLERLIKARLTGLVVDDVVVSQSAQFMELYPGRQLPPFVRLTPPPEPTATDFAVADDGRLIVSEAALRQLEKIGIQNALVEEVG